MCWGYTISQVLEADRTLTATYISWSTLISVWTLHLIIATTKNLVHKDTMSAKGL